MFCFVLLKEAMERGRLKILERRELKELQREQEGEWVERLFI